MRQILTRKSGIAPLADCSPHGCQSSPSLHPVAETADPSGRRTTANRRRNSPSPLRIARQSSCGQEQLTRKWEARDQKKARPSRWKHRPVLGAFGIPCPSKARLALRNQAHHRDRLSGQEFCFFFSETGLIFAPSRLARGALRGRHERGGGMRWARRGAVSPGACGRTSWRERSSRMVLTSRC
jgi:hypothetical protein